MVRNLLHFLVKGRVKTKSTPTPEKPTARKNPLNGSFAQQRFCGYGWSKIKWYAGRNDLRIVQMVPQKYKRPVIFAMITAESLRTSDGSMFVPVHAYPKILCASSVTLMTLTFKNFDPKRRSPVVLFLNHGAFFELARIPLRCCETTALLRMNTLRRRATSK